MNKEQATKLGDLYLVATPMGNLADMTFRAVNVLKQVELIAAEDTRHSKKLLDHYGIGTPMLSLHEHNEAAKVSKLITRLQKGQNIALISDAGTPLISDPGYRFVEIAHQEGIKVIPIPGPCAAIAGLIVSGLPTDRFVFEGFLPARGAVRKKRLLELLEEDRTIIFYESVHRIVNLIKLLEEVFGADRWATIARELTKTFETVRRDNLGSLKNWLDENLKQIKGEFVVILQGASKTTKVSTEEHQRLLKILLEDLPLKQAVMLATKITGAPRKQLYSSALRIKRGLSPFDSS